MRWPGGTPIVALAAAATMILAAPAGALERRLTLVSGDEVEGNPRDDVSFLAAAPDLRRILLQTHLTLTPSDDDDHEKDIYAWEAGRFELISPPLVRPSTESHGSAEFEAATPDMRAVAWSGPEHVIPGDEEGTALGRDVYVTEGGRTRLVSTGPAAAERKFDAYFNDASRDLRRVAFATAEPLVAEDQDDEFDVYLRIGDTTTLVSSTPGDDEGSAALVSDDGRRVFFSSDDRMTPSDTDGATDIFEWRDGTLTQASIGPAGGNGPFPVQGEFPLGSPDMAGISADGRRVWFYTREALTEDDRDQYLDLYERSDGRTRRVSTGPAGGNGPFHVGDPDDRRALPPYGLLEGFTPDGRRVFFGTYERLTRDDRDDDHDVYLRAGGHTTLVSRRGGRGKVSSRWVGLAGISTDGRRAILVTRDRLTRDDKDDSIDVFEWSDGGGMRRLSHGPRGGNRDKPFAGGGAKSVPRRPTDVYAEDVSADARHVFFSTSERLTGDDRDKTQSLYEHWKGATTLVRFRDPAGRVATLYDGTSPNVLRFPDGRDFVFGTRDRLVAADRDEGDVDLYRARLPSRP